MCFFSQITRMAHKPCSARWNTFNSWGWSSPFHKFTAVVIQRPVSALKSCLKDVEASKVTFLSLLKPDSAVGAVSCPAAALQVCCLVQVWEVLAAQPCVHHSDDLNINQGCFSLVAALSTSFCCQKTYLNVGVGDHRVFFSPNCPCSCQQAENVIAQHSRLVVSNLGDI